MVYERLKEVFDIVGVIDVEKYLVKKFDQNLIGYKSIFVVGLGYPNIYLKQEKDRFVASMYTYGYDYHDVLKSRMDKALSDLDVQYKALVDNHSIDERLCLEMTGLAFKGKNDLMINKDLGSYFFIGLVITKERYKEVIEENTLSCGSCNLCIKACPLNALENGFNIDRCMSAYNQSKRSLKEEEINKNLYLLGCDICQRVCPFNKHVNSMNVDEFLPKETTYVEIDDLFNLSNKDFLNKYGKHAYTWKGKTILLRNALTLLLRLKNTDYNEKIKETLNDSKYPEWYKEDAKNILESLEKIKQSKGN